MGKSRRRSAPEPAQLLDDLTASSAFEQLELPLRLSAIAADIERAESRSVLADAMGSGPLVVKGAASRYVAGGGVPEGEALGRWPLADGARDAHRTAQVRPAKPGWVGAMAKARTFRNSGEELSDDFSRGSASWQFGVT